VPCGEKDAKAEQESWLAAQTQTMGFIYEIRIERESAKSWRVERRNLGTQPT
jgi:hypothetical protein